VDAWICNAGVSPAVATVAETTPDVWREIIDVNLTGTFLGARAGAAVMRSGGRIIVTGSVLGGRPRAGLAAYSASKGGTQSLVSALAQELGPQGITVNAVALGWFDTGMGRRWRRDAERDDAVVAHTALGRWGTPADLPGVYLFLASDSSAYLTGTTITVDGGYSLL
jgi:gluconate 5-dehydrogenase